MIEELIEQAQALLLLNESEVIFVDKHEKDRQEISLKYIDYPALIKTLAEEDYKSNWFLESYFKLHFIQRQNGRVLTVYSTIPRTYTLYFNDLVINVPLTGAVIVQYGRKLWVYAYKSNRPLSINSQLYKFPLPNIDSNGLICWGTVSPSQTKIDLAWQSFISSRFNEDYCRNKSKRFPQNIVEQLTDLSQSLNQVYPEEDLIEAGLTLNRLPKIIQ